MTAKYNNDLSNMKKNICLLFLVAISIAVYSQDTLNNNNYSKRFRIAVNGGYSYMPKEINRITPTPFPDYAKKLQSGYNFGLDVGYYFKESFVFGMKTGMGIGAKFNIFETKNKAANVPIIENNGNTTTGKISDEISITYFGPTYLNRLITPDSRNIFTIGLSIGYIGYANNYSIVNNYKMTGNDIGFVMDFGYDRKISDKISIGVQVSSISSHLIDYEIHDGTNVQKFNITEVDNERIYLDHIDFSLNFIINL